MAASLLSRNPHAEREMSGGALSTVSNQIVSLSSSSSSLSSALTSMSVSSLSSSTSSLLSSHSVPTVARSLLNTHTSTHASVTDRVEMDTTADSLAAVPICKQAILSSSSSLSSSVTRESEGSEARPTSHLPSSQHAKSLFSIRKPRFSPSAHIHTYTYAHTIAVPRYSSLYFTAHALPLVPQRKIWVCVPLSRTPSLRTRVPPVPVKKGEKDSAPATTPKMVKRRILHSE